MFLSERLLQCLGFSSTFHRQCLGLVIFSLPALLDWLFSLLFLMLRHCGCAATCRYLIETSSGSPVSVVDVVLISWARERQRWSAILSQWRCEGSSVCPWQRLQERHRLKGNGNKWICSFTHICSHMQHLHQLWLFCLLARHLLCFHLSSPLNRLELSGAKMTLNTVLAQSLLRHVF